MSRRKNTHWADDAWLILLKILKTKKITKAHNGMGFYASNNYLFHPFRNTFRSTFQGTTNPLFELNAVFRTVVAKHRVVRID